MEFPTICLAELAERYAGDPGAPEAVVREAHRRAAGSPAAIWIHRVSLEKMLAELGAAQARLSQGEKLPLFGVPYAVKDSIDIVGIPTTVACPEFAYTPEESSPVVERLRQAGAILVGKTNLDQFATGLVGVRSPYGICENPFDARFVSGGSSSGSALAVATGIVPFSVGTDTAGSGRVPAAFCNIVGLKPTRGLLSTRGLVPACRTIDCLSLFATTCEDACAVLDVCAAFDPRDPYSRDPSRAVSPRFARPIRVGVPRDDQLEFFGDTEAARLYTESVDRFAALGAVKVEIDLSPFRAAAELLYTGPWVVERLHAAGALLSRHPEAIHPTVRGILEGARRHTALDAFEGQYRLADARRASEAEWDKMDVLLLPTTPTIFTIEEVLRDPIGRNSQLGYYTQFANLLDLAAVAVPAGFRADGLPLGVSLIAPAFSDRELLAVAARYCAAGHEAAGASRASLTGVDVPRAGDLLMAVAGAHLSGQPLNHQLTSRHARFVRTVRSAPQYRLYALAGTVPPKPGLVYDAAFQGEGIELEVWSLHEAAFGSFVNEVPPPLAIGTVKLEDGTSVSGFVCEPHALVGATEITSYGGWRRYREAVAQRQ
ncbi:MAG TPA: allophanate hydrolase [Polyangiaceae bacterium]